MSSTSEPNHEKKNQKPTFWNKDLLIGGLIGAACGYLLNSFRPKHGWIQYCTIVGAALGAQNGKKAMKDDQLKDEKHNSEKQVSLSRGNVQNGRAKNTSFTDTLIQTRQQNIGQQER